MSSETPTRVDTAPPSLARNRNFTLLVGGQFVSQMGDRLAMVAFPWLVWQTTHSTMSTGVVLALFTLPYVVFGAFAGAIIDRRSKRAVMVVADLARAVLILAVPFVADHSTTGVYTLAFLVSTATVFFGPSLLSLLPDIVPEKRLLRANSILSASENLTEVVGYAVAGFIVYYLSRRLTFGVDAATFVVSAISLAAMRLAQRPRGSAETPARHSLIAEMREGLAFLRTHAGARANTILVVVAALGVGASYPLTFLLAATHFDGTRDFGFMEAAIAVGFLAGSLALAMFATRVRKGIAVAVGLMAMGACYAVIGLADVFWPVLVVFVVLGLANAGFLVAVDTYLQTVIPEALRGRVWGIRFTLTQGFYAVGVLAAGALAASVEIGTLFVACGLIVAVPGIVGLFWAPIREE